MRFEVHSTAKTAAYALGGFFAVVLVLTAIKQLFLNSPPDPALQSSAPHKAIQSNAFEEAPLATELATRKAVPLVPVIELVVADASLEVNWSEALANLFAGRTEAPVEGGRVDVLTSDYAIEVDRFEKWHEGIGQAAHYGMVTKEIPVVALIISSDQWPLNQATRDKLLLIDETCTKQQVKLILLRRAGIQTPPE
jgi:hypothetical protein